VLELSGVFSYGRCGLGVRCSGTIINARGWAGIGLGAAIKYPQCTTTQLTEHRATHNERLPCHCINKLLMPL
jgi:ferredoxin